MDDVENEQDEQIAQVPRLQIQRAPDDNCNATYSLLNEDHTLGNLMRNQLIKNNGVQFCAYSVPHPSEPIMNVRLQVSEGQDTNKVMKHGLKRIAKMCDALEEKFTNRLEEYKNQM
mmetsp:Transcript_115324/g.160030  ORF Transcript_115324/g.160030 Transcript_115324/m.160030 type:complete len:116 (+) Transcript_115324:71-418(+)